MNLQKLFRNVRFYVLLVGVLLSVVVYAVVGSRAADESMRIIWLTQSYAWTALLYLYVTLLIGPLVYAWHGMPYRGYVYRSRRAVGVSTFYFALLHAYFAFFGELGGFAGLFFLPSRYVLAISLSFTALLILFLMAATSFDRMIQRLGMKRWKFLHRFIYLVGFLILLHALLIGTHFQDLAQPLPLFFFLLVSELLWLQARRFDAYLKRRFPLLSFPYPTVVLWAVGVGVFFGYVVSQKL